MCVLIPQKLSHITNLSLINCSGDSLDPRSQGSDRERFTMQQILSVPCAVAITCKLNQKNQGYILPIFKTCSEIQQRSHSYHIQSSEVFKITFKSDVLKITFILLINVSESISQSSWQDYTCSSKDMKALFAESESDQVYIFIVQWCQIMVKLQPKLG